MSAWQPIETAPKDTAVLVFGVCYVVAHFNTVIGCWIAFGRETSDTRSLAQFPPTHWMALPAPPMGESVSDTTTVR